MHQKEYNYKEVLMIKALSEKYLKERKM